MRKTEGDRERYIMGVVMVGKAVMMDNGNVIDTIVAIAILEMLILLIVIFEVVG